MDYILNVVIQYMQQGYIMEAGYLTNFISNIGALNSQCFIYYPLNNGPPSAGQTTRSHSFKFLVEALFQALKRSFNIVIYGRTYWPILKYLQ